MQKESPLKFIQSGIGWDMFYYDKFIGYIGPETKCDIDKKLADWPPALGMVKYRRVNNPYLVTPMYDLYVCGHWMNIVSERDKPTIVEIDDYERRRNIPDVHEVQTKTYKRRIKLRPRDPVDSVGDIDSWCFISTC